MNDITVQNILDIGNTALTDVKMIPLTKGKLAIVDVEDYDFLSQWKWHCQKGYASRAKSLGVIEGKQKIITFKMHRVIMNTPDDMHTDHINGNPLDNRKCNLRICTPQQNRYNVGKAKGVYSSKYKGVQWVKKNEVWKAQIKVDGVLKYLKSFDNEEDAAKAYDQAALKYFGEFANFNLGKPVPCVSCGRYL